MQNRNWNTIILICPQVLSVDAWPSFDESCKLNPVGVAFKGDNGKYLSHISQGGIDKIEMIKDHKDAHTRFLAGEFNFEAANEKFLSRITSRHWLHQGCQDISQSLYPVYSLQSAWWNSGTASWYWKVLESSLSWLNWLFWGSKRYHWCKLQIASWVSALEGTWLQ